MTQFVRFCADDYALDEASTKGILELLSSERLTATSCLVESPIWPQAALEAQRAGVGGAEMGLHFNLTEGWVTEDIPLKTLLIKSVLQCLDKQTIAQRLNQQLDLFEHYWGQPPAHVDGHQHVHVFPGIRDVLLSVLVSRYGKDLPKLRNITPLIGPSDSLGKLLLLRLVGSGFEKAAGIKGFALNDGFAGVYSLSESANYPDLCHQWLSQLRSGSEVMCHPASGVSASHGGARQHEYDWLVSDDFPALLERLSIKVERCGNTSPI